MSFASISSKIKVQGIVKSFDEKYVTLEQNHKKFKLPRSLFPKDLKPDQDITIEADRNVILKQ